MVGSRKGKVKRAGPSRRVRGGVLLYILCAHFTVIRAVLGNPLSDEKGGRDRNKKIKRMVSG